jgi:glycosyltransferase involved in cell wall biosynthesis
MSEHQEKITLRSAGFNAGLPLSVNNEVEIFLLIPWITKIGGVEKYVRSLLEDLKRAGFRVAVICTEPDPENYEDDSADLRSLGNIVIKRASFSSNKLFVKALSRLAKYNCVSINFGSPWDFQNSSITENIFSKQVCFVFNSDDSMRRAIENSKKFDEFWVAFEGIKRVLPEKIALRSHVIYTGIIDVQTLPKVSSDRSTFNVGFLGRFSPEKKPELFVEIAKFASDHKDMKFVMAGEGPMLETVLKKASKLDNFEYLGVIKDISEFFSNIDCLVISSETEGISLSAMEALSYGIPVLSTNVGGMRELLSDENQGFIWSGKSEDALPLLIELKDKKRLGKSGISLPAKFWREKTSGVVIERINELLT